MDPKTAAELLDWKRHIFALYEDVRADPGARSAWARWRTVRDEMFREHPQSPIPVDRRVAYREAPFFDYDPALRLTAHVHAADERRYDIGTSDGSTFVFTRFGTVGFEIDGARCTLEVYWLDSYGGGVFLPFRDATAGAETYGTGRYLLDTVKGADLGTEGDRLVLDFNFAYNPSCAYDLRWVCPLAPPPNRLSVPIRAGERAVPE